MRQASKTELTRILHQTRATLWAMFEHIDAERARVPFLPIVNPPLWEAGHVAWFEEFWCLRDGAPNIPCLVAAGDELYDSARVAHASRWSLPLPPLDGTREYVDGVRERALQRLRNAGDDDDALYFHRLCVGHEMMHIEAFAYTWQTVGYPAPAVQPPRRAVGGGEPLEVAGGVVDVGSHQGEGFVFDNEQWARPVAVEPFIIDACPVTEGGFLRFVEEGGYEPGEWWSKAGLRWLASVDRRLPRYWERHGDSVRVRRHDEFTGVVPEWPMAHVCAHEAEAYARWSGGRLPTEAEWLLAARSAPGFEWGDSVWEWTASPFRALEGFRPGPYREYSQPWFHDHRVVRGGSFATPRELVDLRFRNFYQPHRDDPYLGFRVCRERL